MHMVFCTPTIPGVSCGCRTRGPISWIEDSETYDDAITDQNAQLGWLDDSPKVISELLYSSPASIRLFEFT